MKWKLLLSLAVLSVAGCASNQESAGSYSDLGFNTDLVPPPVQGLTAADVDLVYGVTAPSSQQQTTGTSN